MTAVGPNESTGSFPFVRYEDINLPHTEPLEHFDAFDEHRDAARFHFGDAAGNEFWLVTHMADIRKALQDHGTFSNRSIQPTNPDPTYKWIPEMLDPPLHTRWRQLLGPLFTPAAVAQMEPHIREVMVTILDEVAPRGECDFVRDVALRFPNVIFMELMGLPVADADQFQVWETEILHSGRPGGERQIRAMAEVVAYFEQLIADRRRDPQDDIVSRSLTWEIEGEPVTDEDLHALCLLLFMAGLDTVAMQLSYSIFHLATHDDDRRRLVDDPSMIPSAIEEFIRYYSFVTPARKVTKDVDFEGCPMKAGQMVWLPLISANRDPAEFPDADKVVIDRPHNRHIGFGAGPHRCLGSNLARLELRVGLEEWHRRIPSYDLLSEPPMMEHGGQIGLDNLPITWDTPSR